MDNRKNTILLTVIAVATLLVAVVGATFAYFTAQGGGGSTIDVEVTTGTTSNTSIMVNSHIYLNVTQDTFTSNTTTHAQSTSGSAEVSWTPSTSASADDLDFCYTVALSIIENDFVYLTSTIDENDEFSDTYYGTAELLLVVQMGTTTITGDNGTVSAGSGNDLDYTTVSTELTGSVRGAVSGWDITGVTEGATYYINLISSEQYKLSSQAGVEETEDWTVYVVMVNKNIDQEYNTGKTFEAQLLFNEVNC